MWETVVYQAIIASGSKTWSYIGMTSRSFHDHWHEHKSDMSRHSTLNQSAGIAGGRETSQYPDRDHPGGTHLQDLRLTVWSVLDWEDMHCPPQHGAKKAQDSACRVPTFKHHDRDHERLSPQNQTQTNREEEASQQQQLTIGGPWGLSKQSVPGGPQLQVFFKIQTLPPIKRTA